ncbi:hypothetical protein [Bacillus sp. KH172YL63]|uniref:hypothetical protein n=1 Tax=Bacillus sp. KH172YL63 TaxID=2709784 RepID=UPI0013E4C132|nr:hypothetical protein [Bacillus sp. KH172YL63]BCB04161.1 hypothetical protein KH172YL63_22940 [Bacillus sp. KH172YL63]
MSENRELLIMLQTLQAFSECDITHSFSEHDSEVLLLSYSKELNSFVILHQDREELYQDIPSAMSVLMLLLPNMKSTS